MMSEKQSRNTKSPPSHSACISPSSNCGSRNWGQRAGATGPQPPGTRLNAGLAPEACTDEACRAAGRPWDSSLIRGDLLSSGLTGNWAVGDERRRRFIRRFQSAGDSAAERRAEINVLFVRLHKAILLALSVFWGRGAALFWMRHLLQEEGSLIFLSFSLLKYA